ncbi:hypothetical protein WA158_000428 [Blastocystis sp. Blastoise]
MDPIEIEYEIDSDDKTKAFSIDVETLFATIPEDVYDPFSTTNYSENKECKEFMKWTLENNIEIRHVRLLSNASGDRGIFAIEDIQDGDILMNIPEPMIITVEMGMETPIGRSVSMNESLFSNIKHVYLSLFLLYDKSNFNSLFHHYYRCLPHDLSFIPFNWTQEQVNLLEGSSVILENEERRRMYTDDYSLLCQLDSTFKQFSLSIYIWSRLIVSSRNFGIHTPQRDSSCLVPLADMVNHSNNANCIWIYHPFSNIIKSSIYYSYGAKPNRRYFLNYGFTLINNISDDLYFNCVLHVVFCLPNEDENYEEKRDIMKAIPFCIYNI